MRLSDVVSGGAGLAVYAQVALVVAVVAFVGLLLYLFVVRRGDEGWRAAAHIPLSDDQAGCEGDTSVTEDSR